MIGFDPLYFLAIAPAMLLAFWRRTGCGTTIRSPRKCRRR